MKKFTGFILAIMIFSSIELFAVKIKIDADTPGNQTDLNQFASLLINESDLAKIGNQKKLAEGMGNAAAYAGSNVASFSGYEGYDVFAIMWGLSAGVVIPPNPDSIDTMIEEEKDLDAGAGLSSAFNLGINLTGLGLDILPNRLYMNIKGATASVKGTISDDEDGDKDWSFKMSTFGLGLNYQLVDRGGDRFKVFKWTGLSLGSGFIYTRNKIVFDADFDEYYASDLTPSGTTPPTIGGKDITVEPRAQFGIDVKTYTIPIEISTSARLLWLFNFTLGGGVDLQFGSSKIIVTSVADVKTIDNAKVGTAHIDGTTKGKPTFLNPKIMTGFGICLGPIPVDVRATYYPATDGAAVNVGLGFVW